MNIKDKPVTKQANRENGEKREKGCCRPQLMPIWQFAKLVAVHMCVCTPICVNND